MFPFGLQKKERKKKRRMAEESRKVGFWKSWV
jgi:hypothetical protein